MNKTSAFGVLISLIAVSGMVYSGIEMRRISGEVASLGDRLAKVENATTVAPSPASGGTSVASESRAPVTLSEMSQELVRLKEEVSAVKSVQADQAALEAAKPRVDGTKVAKVSDEEVKRVVDETLAAKEKEKAEQDAKQRTEWMARAQGMMLDRLSDQLGLTEQQKQQVGKILEVQFKAFTDAWTNRKEGEDIRQKMTDMKTDTDNQIKAVLTTEQQTKYDEVSKQMMMGGGMFGGGGRNRGPGGGGSGGTEGGGGR